MLQENSTGTVKLQLLASQFRVNGWHGITSVVELCLVASLDNSSDREDFEPNAAQPNDSTHPQLEYGPSNFNMPQPLYLDFRVRLPKMGGASNA